VQQQHKQTQHALGRTNAQLQPCQHNTCALLAKEAEFALW
jgi:hypothetical protein